ncbi:helix-turn-helix domain-containing protein [Streptomyces sp. NPDC002564]|uniref:helix-turn-helix domain-containing protein n=1 Tax=Streptomyces sp. NPDC002564 TaxID=3364649 RepID=UPI00367F098E
MNSTNLAVVPSSTRTVIPARAPRTTPLPPPAERRRVREQWGLTPHQVAAAFGVTAATVRSWEAGRTAPVGARRAAYAQFLRGLAASPLPRSRPRPAGPRVLTPTPVAMRPGAAPTVYGRPVLGPPDPVCARRVRRLRRVALGVVMWGAFVHLMVTAPLPLG